MCFQILISRVGLRKTTARKDPESEFQRFLREGVEVDNKGRQVLTDHDFSDHKPHVVERFELC